MHEVIGVLDALHGGYQRLGVEEIANDDLRLRGAATNEDIGATGQTAHAPIAALQAPQKATADVAGGAREEHGLVFDLRHELRVCRWWPVPSLARIDERTFAAIAARSGRVMSNTQLCRSSAAVFAVNRHWYRSDLLQMCVAQ
jgi:hypothetical protein